MWALRRSVLWLSLAATFQLVVALASGSVGLLADTIHNFGDAATAVPLWIAFVLARRPASRRFTYGYGRVEDLAGLGVILVVLLSGLLAGYTSLRHFFSPEPIEHLWAVVVAALVGFVGNEAAAIFRIRVGREINSAALVADGHHARVDGLASLAVLIGALGIWLGYPVADAAVGLIITFVIVKVMWDSVALVFTRLLGGIEPAITDQLKVAAQGVAGVLEVTDVRAHWLGHRLHAEVNIAVERTLSVAVAHEVSEGVRRTVTAALPYLSNIVIHLDPDHISGEQHHVARV